MNLMNNEVRAFQRGMIALKFDVKSASYFTSSFSLAFSNFFPSEL